MAEPSAGKNITIQYDPRVFVRCSAQVVSPLLSVYVIKDPLFVRRPHPLRDQYNTENADVE